MVAYGIEKMVRQRADSCRRVLGQNLCGTIPMLRLDGPKDFFLPRRQKIQCPEFFYVDGALTRYRGHIGDDRTPSAVSGQVWITSRAFECVCLCRDEKRRKKGIRAKASISSVRGDAGRC